MSEGQCFNATHVANPVRVNVSVICNVGEQDENGSLNVVTEDGYWHLLSAAMISRHVPVIGDYIVIQERDGYKYVNPKEVFESKYSVIGEKNV